MIALQSLAVNPSVNELQTEILSAVPSRTDNTYFRRRHGWLLGETRGFCVWVPRDAFCGLNLKHVDIFMRDKIVALFSRKLSGCRHFHFMFTVHLTAPQTGTADAEIKDPSVEKPELKDFH